MDRYEVVIPDGKGNFDDAEMEVYEEDKSVQYRDIHTASERANWISQDTPHVVVVLHNGLPIEFHYNGRKFD